MRNLVVVESPAKSKTVARYLSSASKGTGKDKEEYEILATGGHIYESNQVDVDHDFELQYQLIPSKEKNVRQIVSAMRKAERLYLATDPDREGEAISAHVLDVLSKKGALKSKPVHRIVFHEVTGDAVRNAIANPGEVSYDLVQAQKSRDALDMLVGFNLSPLLIRKLSTPHLSAGRVQSPALRLIVERQREIAKFEAREFWTIKAEVNPEPENGKTKQFDADLTHLNGKKLGKFDLSDERAAREAVTAIQSDLPGTGSELEAEVLSIENKKRIRRPLPPFTTSTLIQEASRKLGMNARLAASVAQRLYEGLTVNGTQTGLITYTRTDSVTLSGQAIGQIRAYAVKQLGADSIPKTARQYRTKSKNAQEAHEAIRPTDVFLTPEKVAASLTKDQLKLYSLIWRRAVACQMNDAIYDDVIVTIGSEQHQFRANGTTLRIPGWLAVYQTEPTDKNAQKTLPPLSQNDRVRITKLVPEQHFTQPPPRYNTGSLIKQLEEYGIGRPSTWPAIITKLQERNYVEMSKQAFVARSLGCVVVDYLMEHFNKYVDYQFTSQLEDRLDAVARGEQKRTELLGTFWTELNAQVEEKTSAPRFEKVLGVHPDSKRDLLVRVRTGGSFIQLGRMDDEEGKPLFKALPPGTDPGLVTLEDAINEFNKPQLPRALGPTTGGLSIEVRDGRFGPYFCAESADGKVETISLDEGQDPHTVTIEEIELILARPKLPRTVGMTEEGEEITARKGRFGPYLSVVFKDGTKRSVSIPKGESPSTISLERALELVAEAKKNPYKSSKTVIKKFDDSAIQVLEGRYGPYVSDGKINATVPRDLIPADLDIETCKELIAKKAASKPAKRKKLPRKAVSRART